MKFAVAFLAVALYSQEPDLDRRMEAAIHREVVQGDLPGAVEQYRSIVAGAAKSRPLAAQALFQMGQCLEKLGRRQEAHAAYSRTAGEFADQAAFAAKARTRLAGWTDALPGPRNLRFEQGDPGEVPPGWFVPSLPGAGHVAELRRKGCRSEAGCVVIAAPANAGKPVASLMQSFSASAYRGKTVRLRAWLRLEGGDPADRAQLSLRVVRTNGQSGLFDSSEERPVRSTYWTRREITSEIDADAQFLDFVVSSIGKGRVWADEMSFEVVPPAEVEAAREAVQKLEVRLDPSVLAPDAQFRRYDISEPLEGVAPGGRNIVTAFRFAGNGAVATVHSDLPGTVPGVRTFRDTWNLTSDGWKLRQRVQLGTRYLAPPTDSETTKLVAADLKQFAAPLATAEPGHTFYDLMPLGNAIADARVVALGSASSGTREFIQMKHRLLEYLVKEKGFTVLAAPVEPAAARAVDHYIKTGAGDLRETLSGLRSPLWDTQDGEDAIEWMRGFNQALIPHPTLSFAAASEPHAGERTIFWATNRDVALPALRQTFGEAVYSVGFAFHRGELRAAGFQGGNPTGVGVYRVPPVDEGSGDAVLGAAGMPLFFLDIRAVQPMTTLGRWLTEPHLFLNVGSGWNQDGPENHQRPVAMHQTYDGLIFFEEGHATKPIEASHANHR